MGTSTLHVKRDVLGLGRSRTYELYKIRNLRVAPQPTAPWDTGMFKLSGIMGCLIAFEFEGKTIRFGTAIDEPEAQTIIERMQQRFSFPMTPARP